MQNGFIERKNGSLRRELLNAYLFDSLNEVREMVEQWRWDYNTERPHKALGYLSPIVYADKMLAAERPQAANENDPKIEESRDADNGKTTSMN
jgi:transposase InsO family protein